MTGVLSDTRSGDPAGQTTRVPRRALISVCLLCGCWFLLADCNGAQLPAARAQPLLRNQSSQGRPLRQDNHPIQGNRPLPENRPVPENPSNNERQAEALVDVRVEGNITIPTSAISKYIKTRPGRLIPYPKLQQQIRDDIRSLHGTRWFLAVEPHLRQTPEGRVLIFRVIERPMVKRVEYRGNEKVKTKVLEAITNIKVGGPYDVAANRESVRRIEQHYKDKGYAFVKVQLIRGNDKDDREVIFQIDEGPKVIVERVKFFGNRFCSDALLKTKLRTKTAPLGIRVLSFFGGKYDPSTVRDDIASLKQYYQNLGFFDIEIEPRIGFTDDRSEVHIEYHIDEGDRYKIRNVAFRNNRTFSDQELAANLQLRPGDHFNSRYLLEDVKDIENRYGKLGRLYAEVKPIPVYLEQPGIVDLVYHINEDKIFRVGRINVIFEGDHPHTRESVVLNRMVVHPGDLADPEMIKKSRQRIIGSGLFEQGLSNGVRIEPIVRTEEFDVTPTAMATDSPTVRGQSYEGFDPQSPPNPLFESTPQGDPLQPSFQQPLPDQQPFFQQPLPNQPAFQQPAPDWIDLNIYATEARTGRLMFGVGVNSDAGVVGNIVLEERNFDIARPPRSFQDLLNGTAWRGAGQRLRMEAIPGSIVSRYLVSWSDPYFLDTDYNLGVSGFYYNRFFEDWDEERGGGRVTLGRQITPWTSVSGAIRLENVELSNPDTPTPAILQEAVGSNFLSTFRLTATHDTRDLPFMPSEGHLASLSYEQAFGDFSYPRVEAEGHQYFTVFSRPDGTGKHIVSVGGELGWTGNDTPIFERYFAGGFQSFRGFDFRGVTPRQQDVGIGGRWSLLGTLEYLFPLTAADNIQGVVFTDFGTVEEDVSIDDFRVSVGAGLRLTIPMMGPVPIALDFAYPIVREDFDDKRIFSFYIGLTR